MWWTHPVPGSGFNKQVCFVDPRCKCVHDFIELSKFIRALLRKQQACANMLFYFVMIDTHIFEYGVSSQSEQTPR